MSDRTPADVIARTLMCELDCCQGEDPEASDYRDANDILAALAAAGYRVVPIPDDNARALVHRLRMLSAALSVHRAWTDSRDVRNDLQAAADAMSTAAALLDGQPQDRPDRCRRCGSSDPAVDNLLRYTDRAVPCPDRAWHVGGSGDTR